MSVGEHSSGGDGTGQRASAARARILDTAYELFCRHGVRAVGVDRIVAESGVAKMTLYRHFPSKDALVLEFLELRERLWTYGWLDAELERRAAAGEDRLLAIFDALDEWFAEPDFQGCPFLATLLEIHRSSPGVRAACVRHLDAILAVVERHAIESGAPNPSAVARQLHTLMMGAIVAATKGDRDAARGARAVTQSLLAVGSA
jgi:AcrR family transcriptional regulator